MSFIPFLTTAATSSSTSAAAAGGGLTMLVPLVLILIIMYFFMIRPQNKKQKETEKMIAALKKGDKVITIGGIHGTVASTKEKTVIVKVDDGAKIEFNRTAIATVVVDKPAQAAAPAEEKKGLFGKKKDVASQIKEADAPENAEAEKDE